MIFCVLRWTWSFVFVFVFVCIYVLCFCAATDFSVNKGLYNETPQEGVKSPYRDTTMAVGWLVGGNTLLVVAMRRRCRYLIAS